MTKSEQAAEKFTISARYILKRRLGTMGGAGLKIAKQFEYSTASEAQNRAEREALSEDCAGADAYMVIEDPNSGEVGTPSFLIRLGIVPEFDDF